MKPNAQTEPERNSGCIRCKHREYVEPDHMCNHRELKQLTFDPIYGMVILMPKCVDANHHGMCEYFENKTR